MSIVKSVGYLTLFHDLLLLFQPRDPRGAAGQEPGGSDPPRHNRGEQVQAPHCTENLKQIFPETKLRGLVPNFYIDVSVSNLYISTIGPPILLQQNTVGGPIIYKSLTNT